MISAKLAAVGGLVVLAAVTAVGAYRWHHPCESCPVSKVIGMLGGPSGCAPAPTTQSTKVETQTTAAEQTRVNVEPVTMNAATTTKTETAMFGAGCFWGVEYIFRKIPGVVDTAVGYSGGTTPNATYKQVCGHGTGHAEVVRVEFDPSKISYQKLVEKFFKLHDPTQVNRQGPDYGTQYRSAIFYFSPEQQKTAEAVKQRLNASGKYKAPIATEITKAGEFWKGEEYHQRYFEKAGTTPTCHIPLDDDE